MGNLGLTALTAASSTKKATFDANADILDLAQSDPFTADMTSGNVTLTNQEFRENFHFLGDNVTTTGRTLTIPNLPGFIVVEGDAGNTESFDLEKGTASIAVAPGGLALYISGAGANDLEKVGVDGVAAGIIRSPLETFEFGFDGPGTNRSNSLWNTSATPPTGGNMPFPNIYSDVLGLDLTMGTDGIWQIPAASGIRMFRWQGKVTSPGVGAATYGVGIHDWRGPGEAGNNDIGKLSIFPVSRLAHEMTHPGFDLSVTNEWSTVNLVTEPGRRYKHRYMTNVGSGLAVNPIKPTSQVNDRMIIEVTQREAAGTKPHPIVSTFRNGTPGANEVIMKFPIVRPIKLDDDFAGSVCRVATNPSSATVFDINIDGTKFGEISISSGGVATFSYVADDAVTLTNPGFETGDFTGWGTWGGGGAAIDGSQVNSGSFSLNNGGFDNHSILQQNISTPGGSADALIDAEVRTARLTWNQYKVNSNGDQWGGLIEPFDSGGESLKPEHLRFESEPILQTATGAWNEFTMDSRVPKDTREFTIGMENLDGGLGGGHLDDISLDLTSTDVVLWPGHVLDITAPGALNGLADLSITLKGRLV